MEFIFDLNLLSLLITDIIIIKYPLINIATKVYRKLGMSYCIVKIKVILIT
jgi:hypothetical protein